MVHIPHVRLVQVNAIGATAVARCIARTISAGTMTLCRALAAARCGRVGSLLRHHSSGASGDGAPATVHAPHGCGPPPPHTHSCDGEGQPSPGEGVHRCSPEGGAGQCLLWHGLGACHCNGNILTLLPVCASKYVWLALCNSGVQLLGVSGQGLHRLKGIGALVTNPFVSIESDSPCSFLVVPHHAAQERRLKNSNMLHDVREHLFPKGGHVFIFSRSKGQVLGPALLIKETAVGMGYTHLR